MSFKDGDLVQLKSGGPAMTVLEVNDAGMVICTWFDSKDESQEKAFKENLLKIYKKPKPTRPYIGGV